MEDTMNLTGIMPPIATPFEDGEVAYDKLKENFQKWNRTALSGYVVLGSNGEGRFLNEKERLKMVEVSRECIPSGKTMIVGTGLESTRETIEYTNEASRIGANLALVVAPSYYKASMKPEILHDHYVAVAESSKIGILIYNVPQNTGINMEPDLVLRISRHPNVVGIKDSSGNIGQLHQIIRGSKKGFAVFTGSAPVLFPSICVGAIGGVLAVANVAPDECVRLFELSRQGKLEEARELQDRMTPLAAAVTTKYGIGGLKLAMDLAGYFGGEPRLPLRRPGADAETELKNLLKGVVSK